MPIFQLIFMHQNVKMSIDLKIANFWPLILVKIPNQLCRRILQQFVLHMTGAPKLLWVGGALPRRRLADDSRLNQV